MKCKLIAVLMVGGITGAILTAQSIPNGFPLPNGSGFAETYNVNGASVRMDGPFFKALGTNGRSCASCHLPTEGWSFSTDEVKMRFLLTQGRDPIFRTNDGSNCDHDIDTSSVQGRRKAYSLLLNKGVIRIAMTVPPSAEFTVINVQNPYGCSDTSTLSMYRRPLPATNLKFLSTVMWDGRESSSQTGTEAIAYATNPADLMTDLAHQAVDATSGHAQGSTPLTAQQAQEIANFEMGLRTAQAIDYRAGFLNANGAAGGPSALASQSFFVGINDPLGNSPPGTQFTSVIFNLYDAWVNANLPLTDRSPAGYRASIARGQAVFNSKPISITGVAGLNDELGIASIPGTCGTCHDSPNVGDHSFPAPLNIGVGDVTSPLNVSYLPVITLENNTTHEIKQTTDPGRALITGKWKDIGKVKGPILRGLASRPPYFHNGSAATLNDVVDFYNKRFAIGLTPQEKNDLIAFLSTL